MLRRLSQHHCFVLLRFMITFSSQGWGVLLHILWCWAIIFLSQSMSWLLCNYGAMTEVPTLCICLLLQWKETMPESWFLDSHELYLIHAGSIWSKLRRTDVKKTPWWRKYCEWYHFIRGIESLPRINLSSLLKVPQFCRQTPPVWVNSWCKQNKTNGIKPVFS